MCVPHDDVGSMVSQPSARELPATALLVTMAATESGVNGSTELMPSAARKTVRAKHANAGSGTKQTRVTCKPTECRRIVVVNVADETSSTPWVLGQGSGGRRSVLQRAAAL